MTHPDDAWAWLSPPSSEPDSGQSGEAGRNLAKAFARTFGDRDGECVLAHLRSLTRERVLGPETPDAMLRYVEGQRALIAYLERLAARGRV